MITNSCPLSITNRARPMSFTQSAIPLEDSVDEGHKRCHSSVTSVWIFQWVCDRTVTHPVCHAFMSSLVLLAHASLVVSCAMFCLVYLSTPPILLSRYWFIPPTCQPCYLYCLLAYLIYLCLLSCADS